MGSLFEVNRDVIIAVILVFWYLIPYDRSLNSRHVYIVSELMALQPRRLN